MPATLLNTHARIVSTFRLHRELSDNLRIADIIDIAPLDCVVGHPGAFHSVSFGCQWLLGGFLSSADGFVSILDAAARYRIERNSDAD